MSAATKKAPMAPLHERDPESLKKNGWVLVDQLQTALGIDKDELLTMIKPDHDAILAFIDEYEPAGFGTKHTERTDIGDVTVGTDNKLYVKLMTEIPNNPVAAAAYDADNYYYQQQELGDYYYENDGLYDEYDNDYNGYRYNRKLRRNGDYGRQRYGRTRYGDYGRRQRNLLEDLENDGFMQDPSGYTLIAAVCIGFMILFCIIGGIIYRRRYNKKRALKAVKMTAMKGVEVKADEEESIDIDS